MTTARHKVDRPPNLFAVTAFLFSLSISKVPGHLWNHVSKVQATLATLNLKLKIFFILFKGPLKLVLIFLYFFFSNFCSSYFSLLLLYSDTLHTVRIKLFKKLSYNLAVRQRLLKNRGTDVHTQKKISLVKVIKKNRL